MKFDFSKNEHKITGVQQHQQTQPETNGTSEAIIIIYGINTKVGCSLKFTTAQARNHQRRDESKTRSLHHTSMLARNQWCTWLHHDNTNKSSQVASLERPAPKAIQACTDVQRTWVDYDDKLGCDDDFDEIPVGYKRDTGC